MPGTTNVGSLDITVAAKTAGFSAAAKALQDLHATAARIEAQAVSTDPKGENARQAEAYRAQVVKLSRALNDAALATSKYRQTGAAGLEESALQAYKELEQLVRAGRAADHTFDSFYNTLKQIQDKYASKERPNLFAKADKPAAGLPDLPELQRALKLSSEAAEQGLTVSRSRIAGNLLAIEAINQYQEPGEERTKQLQEQLALLERHTRPLRAVVDLNKQLRAAGASEEVIQANVQRYEQFSTARGSLVTHGDEERAKHIQAAEREMGKFIRSEQEVLSEYPGAPKMTFPAASHEYWVGAAGEAERSAKEIEAAAKTTQKANDDLVKSTPKVDEALKKQGEAHRKNAQEITQAAEKAAAANKQRALTAQESALTTADTDKLNALENIAAAVKKAEAAKKGKAPQKAGETDAELERRKQELEQRMLKARDAAISAERGPGASRRLGPGPLDVRLEAKTIGFKAAAKDISALAEKTNKMAALAQRAGAAGAVHVQRTKELLRVEKLLVRELKKGAALREKLMESRAPKKMVNAVTDAYKKFHKVATSTEGEGFGHVAQQRALVTYTTALGRISSEFKAVADNVNKSGDDQDKQLKKLSKQAGRTAAQYERTGQSYTDTYRRGLRNIVAYSKATEIYAQSERKGAQQIATSREAQLKQLKNLSERTQELHQRLRHAGGSRRQLDALTRGFELLTRRVTATNAVLPPHEANKAFARFKHQLTSVNRTIKELGAAAAGKVGGLSTSFRNLGSAAVFATGPLSGIGARINSFAAIAGRTNLALAALAALAAAAALGLFKLSQAALQVTRNFDRALARFQGAKTSFGDATKELAFLVQTSKKFGVGISDVASGYSRLVAAAKVSQVPMEDVRLIFEGITAAGAAMRLEAGELAGTFRALEQMISKQKVKSEELVHQLGDRLPGAVGLAAEALDRTPKQLYRMLEAGEVTIDKFLRPFAMTLLTTFGPRGVKNVTSFAGATNNLATEWQLFADKFARVTGLAKAVVNSMLHMSDALEFMRKNMENVIASAVGLSAALIAFKLTAYATGLLAVGSAALTAAKGVKTLSGAVTALTAAMFASGLGGFLVLLGRLAAAAAVFIGTFFGIKWLIGDVGAELDEMNTDLEDTEDILKRVPKLTGRSLLHLAKQFNIVGSQIHGAGHHITDYFARVNSFTEESRRLMVKYSKTKFELLTAKPDDLELLGHNIRALIQASRHGTQSFEDLSKAHKEVLKTAGMSAEELAWEVTILRHLDAVTEDVVKGLAKASGTFDDLIFKTRKLQDFGLDEHAGARIAEALRPVSKEVRKTSVRLEVLRSIAADLGSETYEESRNRLEEYLEALRDLKNHHEDYLDKVFRAEIGQFEKQTVKNTEATVGQARAFREGEEAGLSFYNAVTRPWADYLKDVEKVETATGKVVDEQIKLNYYNGLLEAYKLPMQQHTLQLQLQTAALTGQTAAMYGTIESYKQWQRWGSLRDQIAALRQFGSLVKDPELQQAVIDYANALEGNIIGSKRQSLLQLDRDLQTIENSSNAMWTGLSGARYYEEVQSKLDDLTTKLTDIGIDPSLITQWVEYAKGIHETNIAANKYRDNVQQFANTLSQSFKSLVSGAKSFADALRDVIAQLLEMVLMRKYMEPLAERFAAMLPASFRYTYTRTGHSPAPTRCTAWC